MRSSILDELGAVLRRQRLTARDIQTGEPLSLGAMRDRIGARSDETVRRLEAGRQFPPLARLIDVVLPAYGLDFGEWAKLARGRDARRTVAVLRRPGHEVKGEAAHLPVRTVAADGGITIESFSDDLLQHQEMSVTWVELAPKMSTTAFQSEYGRSGHSHEGEEMLLVTRGAVLFTVVQAGGRERSYELDTGEGVLLKSHCEHRAENKTGKPARYAVIWTPARATRLTLL